MKEVEPALSGLKEGFRPAEILTVSEWAEKYRYLSPEASFSEGLYSCSKTPYTRKIMDSLGVYSPYREVVFAKASQIGGTEIGNNWLGYIMHIAPGPTLMLMPTDGTVERNSKIRIDPMIEHCKVLSERVSAKKSRDGNNTINQKKFTGGVLYMGGANSPAVLKSIPVKNVMLDEVDEYPSDLAGQGSADKLAKVRTRFFPNRKIYYCSTPTIENDSIIWAKFLTTDQNYWHVPCPLCGTYQKLEFDQLTWEKGKLDTVKYKCLHCEQLFEERHKPDILQRGEWKAENEVNISDSIIGFHVNSLYAPYGIFTWADIVAEYEEAEKDPMAMKVFINTILGLPFSESGEAPPFENLYNRRESYTIGKLPKDVCFLTMGVDVQKDRLELEITGWCKDKRSYSIEYRVLPGNTTLPDVWNQLAEVIEETFEGEHGDYPIKLTAIDTGYNSSEVYAFCRKYSTKKVIPIKGRDKLGVAVAPPKVIDYNRQGKRIGQIKLWHVGVSYLKEELYAWLKLEKQEGIAPPNYCHFPQYDEQYFRGLVAEEYIPKKKQWVKKYERNEPLDCRVYSRAASIVIGLDRYKPHQIEAMKTQGIIEKRKPEIKSGSKIESIW